MCKTLDRVNGHLEGLPAMAVTCRRGGKHYKVTIGHSNGESRMLTVAMSPSDRRAVMNERALARRLVREMDNSVDDQ